jgi:hypothetical protein
VIPGSSWTIAPSLYESVNLFTIVLFPVFGLPIIAIVGSFEAGTGSSIISLTSL